MWKGRASECLASVKSFFNDHVMPSEALVDAHFAKLNLEPDFTKWTVCPELERLKAEAKKRGLWNLFLPAVSGLSQREYGQMAEVMGRVPWSAEIFNCNAPDTGNMETLHLYGTELQKQMWLQPLLEGTIRSVFGMTEPAVASSDATNICCTCKRVGDNYVINGKKWWSSGAGDPRAKIAIVMVKTASGNDESVPMHKRQSMILVPMDTPGVKKLRALSVFGYNDAPHGHLEILFDNVVVPATNMLLGEGRGFEIAQGRLGPGRIHHCMRTIGVAERALEMMIERANARTAFGRKLIRNETVLTDIAECRVAIDQARVFVLAAAETIDKHGSKAARKQVAMIKVAVPRMCCDVLDKAIQLHGGMGVCQDTNLAYWYAGQRSLRIADGPDAVHLLSIGKMEARAHLKKLSKL